VVLRDFHIFGRTIYQVLVAIVGRVKAREKSKIQYQVSFKGLQIFNYNPASTNLLQILCARSRSKRDSADVYRGYAMNDAIAQSTQGGAVLRGQKDSYLQAGSFIQRSRDAPRTQPPHLCITALTMNTRIDGHTIEPVPSVVLYKVTKFREQSKRLGDAFARFTIQSTKRGNPGT